MAKPIIKFRVHTYDKLSVYKSKLKEWQARDSERTVIASGDVSKDNTFVKMQNIIGLVSEKYMKENWQIDNAMQSMRDLSDARGEKKNYVIITYTKKIYV